MAPCGRRADTLARLAVRTVVFLGVMCGSVVAQAPSGHVSGRVIDETGGALPGVTVELWGSAGMLPAVAVTTPSGEYEFALVMPGAYQMSFVLLNFASQFRRLPAMTAQQPLPEGWVPRRRRRVEVDAPRTLRLCAAKLLQSSDSSEGTS